MLSCMFTSQNIIECCFSQRFLSTWNVISHYFFWNKRESRSDFLQDHWTIRRMFEEGANERGRETESDRERERGGRSRQHCSIYIALVKKWAKYKYMQIQLILCCLLQNSDTGKYLLCSISKRNRMTSASQCKPVHEYDIIQKTSLGVNDYYPWMLRYT